VGDKYSVHGETKLAYRFVSENSRKW